MDLETIQKFITAGYNLHVSCRHLSMHQKRYHASVDLGTDSTSHNFVANSIKEALEGLEGYLRWCGWYDKPVELDLSVLGVLPHDCRREYKP